MRFSYALLLALSLFGTSFAKVEEPISPPTPPEEKGIERFNTTAGYQMFKTPNRLKVEVKERLPNHSAIIKEMLSKDWTPAEAGIERISLIKKKGKAPEKRESSFPQKAKKESVFFLEGECYLPERVEVKSFKRYVNLSCVFGTKTGQLEALLTVEPNTGNLIAVPKSLKIGEKNFEVVKGILLTKEGSLNVADKVNRQFLKRILTAGAVSGFHSGFEAYKEYAQNKDTTTYTVDGGTVVQEKSIPPNYPLISAVLGAVDGMAKVVEKILVGKYQTIPTIYVVEPKTLVFKGEVREK